MGEQETRKASVEQSPEELIETAIDYESYLGYPNDHSDAYLSAAAVKQTKKRV